MKREWNSFCSQLPGSASGYQQPSFVSSPSILPPVSPHHSPTTTNRQCRAGPASQCPPSPCRHPCPACLPATAARRRHPADSTSCVAPTEAAKPGCCTTTTQPAATSFLCWLTRWAWYHYWSTIYLSYLSTPEHIYHFFIYIWLI